MKPKGTNFSDLVFFFIQVVAVEVLAVMTIALRETMMIGLEVSVELAVPGQGLAKVTGFVRDVRTRTLREFEILSLRNA